MSADLILAGGRIYPLGRFGGRPVSHLAVAHGTVFAAGGAELLGLRGKATRMVDLGGRAVLPGFDDAHAHVVYEGLTSHGADLAGARSISEIQRRVRATAARLEPGEWLIGRGYAEQELTEGRAPTRWELDEATAGRPAFIDHRGGHSRVANSAALAAAGLGGDSADPPGGALGRDAAGGLDGRLQEAAMRLVADVQPPPTLARRMEGILKVQARLLRVGVTSIGDAVNRGFADDLRAFARLLDEGRLSLRVNQFLSFELLDAAVELGLGSGSGSHRLRAGPVKYFVDGGASTGTAAFRSRPFAAWRTPPDELRQVLERAQQARLQVATHCVGDAAIEAMLDAVEHAQTRFPGPLLRHRVEHCTVCPPDLRARMRRLGVMAVMQPLFAGFGRSRLAGPEGATDVADVAAHRALLKAGVRLAFSSDTPFASDPNPWSGLAAAVTDPDRDQRLTPLQALRCYTEGGAWSSHEEGFKGSLEPGRAADLCVYSADPLRVSPKRWPRLRPLAVYVAGRRVSAGRPPTDG